MSSDIPGFYYDRVQRRYYRLPSESFNGTPSARRISERARQEEFLVKQSNLIDDQRKRSKRKDQLAHSRLDLFRQRQYGRISSELYRRALRWSLIGSLHQNCFSDDKTSVSLSFPINVTTDYELLLTPFGECLQLIDFQLYLTHLSNRQFTYRLPESPTDGIRSSHFMDCQPYFMSSTLLNDETSVVVRFVQFSLNEKENFSTMISTDQSAPKYFFDKIEQIIVLSSTSNNYNSSLRMKTGGPCCYSRFHDNFAVNIDNYLNVYDFRTFRRKVSIRVPIHRVTLSDVTFSRENSNFIFTTNGNQCQQWDIRQSSRAHAVRLPISCSKIKILQTKPDSILTSSFDERINLIDLRFPTKSLLVYDFSPSTTTGNNPHFSFSVDFDNEYYIAACSQNFIVNIWDLGSGQLLNRFLCPIRERFMHKISRCAITSIDNQPVLAIYHPEYSRLNRWR